MLICYMSLWMGKRPPLDQLRKQCGEGGGVSAKASFVHLDGRAGDPDTPGAAAVWTTVGLYAAPVEPGILGGVLCSCSSSAGDLTLT